MYNDRTQYQDACFRAGNMASRQSAPMCDLPNSIWQEGDTPRRRCDGTLRTPRMDGNCKDLGWGLTGHPLAMVYSPFQMWQKTYPTEKAFVRGTLFEELDLPFESGKCRRGIM